MNFGPKAWEAAPALTEALQDSDKSVRVAAAYALGEIGPDAEAAVPALEAMRADRTDGLLSGAAAGSGRLPVTRFQDRPVDRDRRVRAAEALDRGFQLGL